MRATIIICWWLILCDIFLSSTSLVVKFTNIECQNHDQNAIEVKLCQLKAVGRNKIALNTYVKLLQKPINNISVKAQFYRKSMDYRPFLYKADGDYCMFVKNPSRYLFWKILLDEVLPYTNINHSCPYDHDLVVKNLILNENFIKLIPFPPDEYMVRMRIFFSNSLKLSFKVYALIK